MIMEELADEVIETDFLIIGGGLGGCMAAIRAKENKGVDVTIVEKAVIRTSGEVRSEDHYPAIAHPQINGVTAEEYGNMRADDFKGLVSRKLSIVTAKDALKPLVVLEQIGVKIREDNGSIKMMPGRIGGGFVWHKEEDKNRVGDFIYYRGADIKIKLAAAVARRGVRVFNRTMATNLITKDGSVVGATALNTRTGQFFVFKAKATLLSTGGVQRLYGYPYATFPNNLFYSYNFPRNHGGGAATAYRAGAKLVNLEYVYVHTASAGFPGGGGGIGVFPKNSRGEILNEKYPEVVTRYGRGGFFPATNFAYMPNMLAPEVERDVLMVDTPGASEDIEPPVYFTNANESPYMLKVNQDRGGIRKAPFEIRPWITGLPRNFSGILPVNDISETSLKCLFVAGDAGGGLPLYGAPAAFVWAYRIADYVTEYAPGTKQPMFDAEQVKQVQAERERVYAPLGRKEGVNALELEDYVRKIMMNYVQIYKVEPRLKRALELLKVIKEKFVPALAAGKPHELMNALEVQDIIDVAEIHTQAALLRTETRMPPYHYRVDYPEQDDVHWKKNIVIQNVAGEMKCTLETLD